MHDVHILNTLNIRWQKLVSLSLRFYIYEYMQLQLDLSSGGLIRKILSLRVIMFEKEDKLPLIDDGQAEHAEFFTQI